MLVYGDASRTASPQDVVADLAARVATLVAMPAGIARHAALVGIFVDAAMLAQGVADAEQPALDRRTPASDATMQLVLMLAHAVRISWESELRALPPIAVGALPDLPSEVRLKEPEGYAFYALYPETYLAAARGRRADAVVGLRSIGTGLAALVAAATDAPLPATVRPRGDPYHRQLVVAPALAAEWRTGTVAIVDEGPGRSGSSFAAVIDAVGDPARVECYPSHRGDLGPEAPPERRAQWQRVTRHVASYDEVIGGRLSSWLAELVGTLVAPLEDISGGTWRRHRFAREADWPASVTFQERIKLLARTARGTWLVRFVGLGARGEQILQRARALHAAGFTPEVAGLCHGFLVERWLDAPAPAHFDAARVGAYLRHLDGCRDDAGASTALLGEMVRRNASLALGVEVTDIAARLAQFEPTPCQIDGRLHPWEWAEHDGRLLKLDAHDHHRAHDLVGCQDIAWDLAGAEVELGVTVTGLRSPAMVAVYRIAYLAFQLGRHTLAVDSVDGAEASRLRVASARYGALLRDALVAAEVQRPTAMP